MEAELFDWGRFTEPAFLILISLAGGPKHGYAMMEDIAVFARMRIGPGTLYGALTRLEAHGLVEALPVTERRRPYRITAAGAALLQARLSALDSYLEIARARLAAS